MRCVAGGGGERGAASSLVTVRHLLMQIGDVTDDAASRVETLRRSLRLVQRGNATRDVQREPG